MTQRVAVLTGGTSGLGRFIARGLVQAGWGIVLIARDQMLAMQTRAWLLEAAPHTLVEVVICDLSLIGETRRAAADITAVHPSIGLLVLNAGTFQSRRRVTTEGHELVLAVNHLSPFVLTGALTPALSEARIVFVGSSASDRARIDPDNLELTRDWGMQHAYSQSKLAGMITAFTWAQRLAPSSTVNVVHPGLVATGLVKDRGAIGLAWAVMAQFALTPEQGAAAPLRAALDPALGGVSGRYLKPRGFGLANRRTTDAGLAARIWQATERLISLAPPAS